MTYANMDNVASQVSGSSSVLAADWNTYVRDNFDDLKAGHVVLTTPDRLALGTPATGTMVFDSTLNILMFWNGSTWVVSPGSSLTSAQKIAIPTPATGSFIYDSTLGVFQSYNGSAWVNAQGSPPSLTTAQKTALGTPATGTVVYDSTLGRFETYNGTAWVLTTVPPSLTTAQKTALSSAPYAVTTGTMVYDSTLNSLQKWTGSTWTDVVMRRTGYVVNNSGGVVIAAGVSIGSQPNLFSSNISFTADGTTQYTVELNIGYIDSQNTTAATGLTISLWDVTNTTTFWSFGTYYVAATQLRLPATYRQFWTPAAGTYTCNVRAYPFVAAPSSGLLYGSSGTGSFSPCHLSIWGAQIV